MILFPIAVGVVMITIAQILYACLKKNQTATVPYIDDSEKRCSVGSVKTDCIIKGFTK